MCECTGAPGCCSKRKCVHRQTLGEWGVECLLPGVTGGHTGQGTFHSSRLFQLVYLHSFLTGKRNGGCVSKNSTHGVVVA